MKIALCFAGQPRHVRETYEKYIKPNLFDLNDQIDVFYHMWFDESKIGEEHDCSDWVKGTAGKIDRKDIDDLNDIYNVIQGIEEPQKTFELPREYTYAGDQGKHIPYSMFYSVMESIKYKEFHETTKGFKYDWAIRCRTDFGLLTPINLRDYKNDKVYLPNNCQIHAGATPNSFNDMFAFSNSSIIDHYGTMYHHIDEYYVNDGIKYVQEALLGHHFLSNNVDVSPEPIQFKLTGR